MNLGRSNGQQCNRIFWEFCWKSFLFKSLVWKVRHCCPDGRTSAACNFHIRLRASGPWGMSVQTAELQHAISIYAMRAFEPWGAGIRTVEVESIISILVARASRPRLTDVRTVIFEMRFLPYVWARPEGNLRRPDGWSNLPLNWTWKESKSDRSLRSVWMGCWDVRKDTG
jgi:hypothetical protein